MVLSIFINWVIRPFNRCFQKEACQRASFWYIFWVSSESEGGVCDADRQIFWDTLGS